MHRRNKRKSTEINGNQRNQREDTSRNNPSNEVIGNYQNRTIGAESTIECFSNNSVSTTYVPNQEHLIESLTTIEHSTEEVFNLIPLVVLPTLTPLVAVLKEQAAEIENLKISVSDLVTANASLRNKLNEKTKQLSEAEEKIHQLSNENRELSDENSSVRHESNLEHMISDLQGTFSDLRTELDQLKSTVEQVLAQQQQPQTQNDKYNVYPRDNRGWYPEDSRRHQKPFFKNYMFALK